VILASVLAGCATARPGAGDLPAQEFAGHFTGGAGGNWFRPCSASPGDTLWWTTFMSRSVAQWDSLKVAGRVQPDVPSYVRVLAGLSDRRTAGADGRGTRYLYVHDVLETRPVQPGDCGR
jgi:hypothetical protein